MKYLIPELLVNWLGFGIGEEFRPEGMEDADWADMQKFGIAIGNGAINIDYGQTAVYSDGCVLISGQYVQAPFQLEPSVRFDNVLSGVTYYNVTQFESRESKMAQVVLSHLMFCARKVLGEENVTFSYNRIGPAVPSNQRGMNGSGTTPPPPPPRPNNPPTSNGPGNWLTNFFNR